MLGYPLYLWVVVAAALFSGAHSHSENLKSLLKCAPGRFLCKNAYRCLLVDEICDGVNNCRDNSDEDVSMCIALMNNGSTVPSPCEADEFACKNGLICFPKQYMCDGRNHCADNSDEDRWQCINEGLYDGNITCSHIGFQCPSQNGPNSCIAKSQLCDGHKDCHDGSDEHLDTCIREGRVHAHLSCSETEFACKNGFKCISKRQLCDADNDCKDGSDEDPAECVKEGILPDNTTCADLGFECRGSSYNGTFCIGNLFICDGHNNCGDNSDEDSSVCWRRAERPRFELLPWYESPAISSGTVSSIFGPRLCGNDQFQCKNEGQCIRKRYLCDRVKDCRDGSDETWDECRNRSIRLHCRTDEFRCKDRRKCISRSYLCDRDADCADGSDEEPELCASRNLHTTTPAPPTPVLHCSVHQFKCRNNQTCIPITDVCDGDSNCGDSSDEEKSLCDSRTTLTPNLTSTSPPTVTTQYRRFPANCGRGQFLCASGLKCVRMTHLCDGDDDCGDQSDERHPICLGEVWTWTCTTGATAVTPCDKTATGPSRSSGEVSSWSRWGAVVFASLFGLLPR